MPNPAGLPSVCSTSVPYQLFYRAVSNTSASASRSEKQVGLHATIIII